MEKKAHIISHTHWDREWYINSKYVNEWLPPFFDGLFAMMEKEPSYAFVLDGQTSILDDCYVELEKLGRSVEDFKEKISHFAKRGQLVLGPYYLQPDWQLVSGESLVRNMLIGRKMSLELGGGTSTGWLLDNFGQISQAPQLHQQFGMKGLVVWRGVELDPFHLTSEFEWVGADGTKMTASYLLSSYRNAMHLADYPGIIYDRIRNETEKIAPFSTTGNVLLMNGYDQEMQPDDILPYLRDGKADFGDFTVCQSTPDSFMNALLSSRKELPQLHGALYSGRYISVFPGILSSRMYLKQMNDTAQRQLEQYAEPLCAMSSLLGKAYPYEALEKSWKLMLKNHPHDSICGVSVDDVHHDMVDRFQSSLEISRKCTAEAVGWLSAAADTSMLAGAEKVYTLFNTLPVARKASVFLPVQTDCSVEVKDTKGRVCKVQPAKGGFAAQVMLSPFSVEALGVFLKEKSSEAAFATSMEAENEYLHVTCEADGSFTVQDKITGKSYTGIGVLEDSADSGDEYNYSFLTGDQPITTAGLPAKVEMVEQGPVRTVFKVTRVWNLPESLTKNRESRSSQLRELPIETTVTLTQGDPVLRFTTSLRNTCKDHRIRVLFPTAMDTDVSYAQTQFDVTEHPIVPAPFDNSTIPENVKRIIIGARESLPITQFPQRDFCAVSEKGITAAVVNMGLPEYEVLPENRTVALTLFRSIGWLTRFDLNTRIGDAGPEMFTPGAQCLRDMTFTYGFCSLQGQPDSGCLDQAVQAFCTPVLTMESSVHTGAKLPELLSLEENAPVHITAVKAAENGEGLALRLYNVGGKETSVKLVLPFGETVSAATPYEEETRGLSLEAGTVQLTMKPKEILTLLVKGKKMEISPVCAESPSRVWYNQPEEYDFSQWEIPCCVTEEEAQMEAERGEKAWQAYLAKQAEADSLAAVLQQETSTPEEKQQAATVVMEAHALHRAALEAKLSAVFTKEALKRLQLGEKTADFTSFQDSLAPELRELAYSLNLARIDKRVSEYITDYYTQQVKEKGKGV